MKSASYIVPGHRMRMLFMGSLGSRGAGISSFVDRMMQGKREHPSAFVSFVISKRGAKRALIYKDSAGFTFNYIGDGYRRIVAIQKWRENMLCCRKIA
jgi:hypothetical protein